MVSVIIPALNEEAMVERAADAIAEVIGTTGETFEILFVDDGSTDGTWDAICRAAQTRPFVAGIRFSRNFGKEAAISAGLRAAGGECAVVMDCDLQHPPAIIPEMLLLWKRGYEVIEGIKTDRGKESAFHRRFSALFYRLISRAVGKDLRDTSDFKLLDRKVIDAINQMPERKGFFRANSVWVGFRRTELAFEVHERTEGVSKWNTKKLARYALSNLAAFSTAPLQWITGAGVVSLALSLLLVVISVITLICGGVAGTGLLLFAVLFLIGGILMVGMGIIGYYIGRIYDEVQARPRYIVAEVCDKKTRV